jgi:hypothetical protein
VGEKVKDGRRRLKYEERLSMTMKKRRMPRTLILVALLAIVLVVLVIIMGSDKPTQGNCLADDCLLVSQLQYPVGNLPDDVKNTLDTAITDEYKAHAFYQKVIEKFGPVRPFSMIIRSEEQHITALKAIYDKYGLPIPEDDLYAQVKAPATLQEACQAGVQAEIENADLYEETLLPAVKDYEDITRVYTSLMSASRTKHLVAFQRCS